MAGSLPDLKPCPVCGGLGKMRYGEMPLAECQDAQCGFITSHYYWQNIAVLLQQASTKHG